jgi:excisionase family DNA binding protein
MGTRSGVATTLTARDAEARSAASRLAAQVDDTTDIGSTVRGLLEDVARGEQIVVLRSADEISPAEAAKLLGVTRQFVDRLLADGTLQYRRLPNSRHRKILATDVVALFDERERRRQGATAIRSALG